jgi:uncharacterized protein RhaS with RHS repeats
MHPDPVGLAAVDPSNPQSWNRYAYVLNDPMDWVDPLGLGTCKPNDPNPACHANSFIYRFYANQPGCGGTVPLPPYNPLLAFRATLLP